MKFLRFLEKHLFGIDSLDRWYAYGDRHKLATDYPGAPVAFFPPNGSYVGNATENTYVVKPGTTGPNITADDFFINETPSQTFIPIAEGFVAPSLGVLFGTPLVGQSRRVLRRTGGGGG